MPSFPLSWTKVTKIFCNLTPVFFSASFASHSTQKGCSPSKTSFLIFTLFLRIPNSCNGSRECMLSCPALYNPMDYSPPGSSVCGIFQAVLEWVSISYSRGSSQPRYPTLISCIGRWAFFFLTTGTTWKAMVLFSSMFGVLCIFPNTVWIPLLPCSAYFPTLH